MAEKWADVIGYEGLYEISTLGNVRNKRTAKLLQFGSSGNYLSVMLYKDGRCKRISIHRMVALAFVPNPHGLRCVNHKDENTHNNCVENLEWCTHKYNSNYGTAISRRVNHTDWQSASLLASMRKNARCAMKPVMQIENGNVIARYESIAEASKKTGVGYYNISNVARKKPHCYTAGGFNWEFEKTN